MSMKLPCEFRRIKQERMLAARRQRDTRTAETFIHRGF
jgi:hypothetical protein